MSSVTFALQQLVGSNMLTKKSFINCISEGLSDCDANEANFFIDLAPCVSILYSEMFDISSIVEETELAGAIINMVIYYRKLFHYLYGVNIKTYLVFSENCGRLNRLYVSDYNQSKANSFYRNKPVREMVNKNMELLDRLCPYLNDTTLFTTEFESTTGIKYIMDNHLLPNMQDKPCIVLSKDIMATQLLGSVKQRVIIIRPKKRNGEDISYCIKQGDAVNYLLASRRSKRKNSILNDGWMPFILACGCKERNLKSVIGLDELISELETGVKECRYLNQYQPQCYNVIGDMTGTAYKKLVNCSFEQRYKAIDINYQCNMLNSSPDRLVFKPIQNLFSPKVVGEIFMKYFKKTYVDYNSI